METDKPKNFCGKVAIKIFLIDKQGNLLVVRQKQDEPFEVPGGRVDENESIEQTVGREIYEELDISVENVKYEILNSFQANNPNENINHFYLILKIDIDDELVAQMKRTVEVVEMVWVNKENYKNYTFRKFLNESIINFINK